MTMFKATAAMLLLGGAFSAADRTVVAAREVVAARQAQGPPSKPAAVTITLVRWPFT